MMLAIFGIIISGTAMLVMLAVGAVGAAVTFGGCETPSPQKTGGDEDLDAGSDASDDDTFIPPDGDTSPDKPDDDGGITDGDDDGGEIDDDGGEIDDDGGEIDDDGGEVDDDGGEIDDDGGEIDDDGGEIDDDGGDDDTGEDPVIPGYNAQAFSFTGSIQDLDAASEGRLRAYGGDPAEVLSCTLNGIANVQCETVAQTPVGNAVPINALFRPGVQTTAIAESAGGNPFQVYLLDESGEGVDETHAIDEVPVPGFSYTPTFASGIAAHFSEVLEDERTFVATANWVESESRFLRGTILVFGENSRPERPVEHVGFTSGVNLAALGMATLDLDGTSRPWLVAFNAGWIADAMDRTAGIDLIDPEPIEIRKTRWIDFGDVEMVPLPELAFDGSGTVCFAVQESPTTALVRVDLATSEVLRMPLDGAFSGTVIDLVTDGATIYIAQDRGAPGDEIIRIETERIDGAPATFTGEISRYTLDAQPLSLATSGGYLYAAGADAKLHALDPVEAEWE